MTKTEIGFFENNYIELGKALKRKYTDEEIKDIHEMFMLYFEGIHQNKYVGFLSNYDYMPNYKTAITNYYKVGDIIDINKLKKIMNNSLDNIDLFFTINPLSGNCGLNEKYISSFTNISVDIDFYNIKKYKDSTPEDMFAMLKKQVFGKRVPMPSAVLFSGKGLHITWRLKNYYHICSPKEDSNKGEIVYIIRDNQNKHIIGEDKLKEFYGNNEHIQIKCETNPNMITKSRRYSSNLSIVKKIKERLITILKAYGAEGGGTLHKDRVVHTINSKSGERVKFKKLNDYKYSISELIEWCGELFSEESKNVMNKVNLKKKKGNPSFTKKSYRKNVLKDLEEIQQYANEIGDTMNGYKYHMNLIYRCVATELYGVEKGFKAMKEFNRNFLVPRDEEKNNKQTESAFNPHECNGAERNSYWYKTETIRNLLSLDRFRNLDEKLKILISNEEKKRRKAQRNKQYYENVTRLKLIDDKGKDVSPKKQKEKNERNDKIIELHSKGMKAKEIAELTQVHLATVYRYIKKAC